MFSFQDELSSISLGDAMFRFQDELSAISLGSET
jgi:hypothetical protein